MFCVLIVFTTFVMLWVMRVTHCQARICSEKPELDQFSLKLKIQIVSNLI